VRTADEHDGQVAYDLDDFRRHHGDPTGQAFTFEVTANAITYVYANVTGTIRANKVVFDLYCDDLVEMQRAH
jgi:hypothetical protein